MWRRRELLGALATGAAGLTVATGKVSAAQTTAQADTPEHAAMKKSCCEICAECADACNKAFHHCIQQAAGGKLPHARMAQTVVDCAAFCALSAQMISRGSRMMSLACGACAEACRTCAQECESFDTDLEMKICLDACKRCEESCRNMVKVMGDEPPGRRGESTKRQ
jgi:hypothetical protein